ncbi:MAG: Fic family protein [Candidatus Margulisiibacteriota bacterium]
MHYKPIYRITPYLLNQIEEAGKLQQWIESATINVPWLPSLQREAKAINTHSSTSIEGNPLSLPQVEAIARGDNIGSPEIYKKEVENYLQAMLWVAKYPKMAITEKTILKMHGILLKDILSFDKCGKYKAKQNYVANERGIRIYTPPNPKETPKLMQELINWVNSKETKNLHSVLICAIFHHHMVSIHPFADGNGRIARALGTLILYQRGFDTRHIFSLDEYFAGNRQRYYQKIEQARELDNDLTHWIEYVADGIIATLKNVKKRIEDLQVTSQYKIALTPRQEDILRILRDNPLIGVHELKNSLKVSRARINQIIMPLVKGKLIIKEGKSRATRYKLA